METKTASIITLSSSKKLKVRYARECLGVDGGLVLTVSFVHPQLEIVTTPFNTSSKACKKTSRVVENKEVAG